jgi:NTP pyrophosphatase (non-canonical NTP hydrolase)
MQFALLKGGRKLTKDVFRQKELSEWQRRNFTKGETGNCDICVFHHLAGMCEELGELAHALLKFHQGIRGMTEEKMKEEVADAFGDVIVYGTQLLSELNIDAQETVEKTVREVLKRDWKKDKTTGGTEACHKGGEHEWKEISKGDYKYKKCAKCDILDLRVPCKNDEHDWSDFGSTGFDSLRCVKCGVEKKENRY